MALLLSYRQVRHGPGFETFRVSLNEVGLDETTEELKASGRCQVVSSTEQPGQDRRVVVITRNVSFDDTAGLFWPLSRRTNVQNLAAELVFQYASEA